MTDAPPTLAAALVALQAVLPKVDRNQEGQIGTRVYQYADLAAITDAMLPRLAMLGLSFVASPTILDNGRPVLRCSLIHVSGDREVADYPLPADTTPQQIGAAITYGRRYCLQSMTGLATEDDRDGEVAAQPKPRSAGRGQISQEQIAKIAALMRERGITDRGDALACVAKIIGREVESRNDLTKTEGSKVIEALERNPGFGEQP